jgi:hypothetical protein
VYLVFQNLSVRGGKVVADRHRGEQKVLLITQAATHHAAFSLELALEFLLALFLEDSRWLVVAAVANKSYNIIKLQELFELLNHVVVVVTFL